MKFLLNCCIGHEDENASKLSLGQLEKADKTFVERINPNEEPNTFPGVPTCIGNPVEGMLRKHYKCYLL